jgi:hypothetical protein
LNLEVSQWQVRRITGRKIRDEEFVKIETKLQFDCIGHTVPESLPQEE